MPQLSLHGYHLTYDDEFSDQTQFITSSDGSVGFNNSYYFGRSIPTNFEAEYYVDPTAGIDPFSVQNGALTITAAPAGPGAPTNGLPYSSGVITTQGSFAQNQGYFEMRAQTPDIAGFWAAFWMLPATAAGYTEFDVLEQPNLGPSSQYWTDAKFQGAAQGGMFNTTASNLSAGYHTYGLLWTATAITFYFDGWQVGTAIAVAPDFTTKMYLIANLAVGTSGSWPGATSGAPTGQYNIDYIRAYSNDPTVAAVPLQTISSPDGIDTTPSYAMPTLPVPPAIGTGPDTLILAVDEDYYLQDAQFTISVDGVQQGGVQTAQAVAASGETQQFVVHGGFAGTAPAITINFLNKLNGGASVDNLNLYVTGVSFDGTALTASSLALTTGGPQTIVLPTLAAPATIASGTIYAWGSHALVAGATVTTTQVDAAATPPILLQGAHIDANGNVVGELVASNAQAAQSLQLAMTLPSGVTARFTPAESLPANWTLTANTATPGQVSLGGFGMTALSGPVDLGTLSFTPQPGTTSLVLTVGTDWIGSQTAAPFTLTASTAASLVSGGFTVSAPTDPAARVTGQTVTNAAVGAGASITAADALAALKLAVGLNPNPVSATTGTQALVSPYQFMAADVAHTGVVTAADALAILRMAVGLPSASQPSWEFVNDTVSYWNPVARAFNVTGSAVPTVFSTTPPAAGSASGVVGILVGDVLGQWAPTATAVTAASTQAAATQSAAYFGQLSQSLATPTDQWGVASSTAAGAIVASATAGAPISVIDTAAHVQAQLDGLQTLAASGQLAGVWLSDPGTPSLSLTALQAGSDALAIAAIHGAGPPVIIVPAGAPAPAPATASLSAAITPALVLSGVPGFIDGTTSPSISIALNPANGVEIVSGFTFGIDTLDISLAGALYSDFTAEDVTVSGKSAIYMTNSTDTSHGVVLLGSSTSHNAADLLTHNLTNLGSLLTIN